MKTLFVGCMAALLFSGLTFAKKAPATYCDEHKVACAKAKAFCAKHANDKSKCKQTPEQYCPTHVRQCGR